ncbi:hypothetical protein ASPBRDRAFT_666063 [Aspergillus brasiliensis CBS 101740]|uniref:Uncharacterized protein n=1 Tax=Aspergillus brasiliensis (strain CBS 101740 / IMI 381727 / IBT 21946) TaxID=767769 RepID=A0A1L9U433_ASPBC|nr:hypothetical protein ASPBRDRAFT_666063 [Aspergillus brasiliensis CBS 101740]
MLFSATKTLMVALAVLGFAASAPVDLVERDQKVIIGYRTMEKSKAEAYNKQGTVVWYTASGVQLGDVVYLTPAPGEWKAPDNYCKAWIPETYDGKKLWYHPDSIDSYLKTVEHQTPDETLRLSKISGDDAVYQLGIPKAMLGKTGHLGLMATCKAKASELPQHAVNYKTVQNAVGTPQ